MLKEINIDLTLSTLVNDYPELIDILYDIGFTQIKIPGMLQTAGRFMTLRNGCELRKIDLDILKVELYKHDYIIASKVL